MATPKRQVRLLATLALIVAITLVGLLGIQFVKAFGATFPKVVGDVILQIMFWGSFGLLIYAVKEYFQILKSSKKKNIEFQVVCLLGMVVAISHVGQLGIAGKDYVSFNLLPNWTAHLLMALIFWTAFYFVFAAIKLYRKI